MFNFPKEFDPLFYQNRYPDLQHLTDDQLREHYCAYGLMEGRLPNQIADRRGFVSLIPQTSFALEIGPFFSPILHGPNVRYFDVLSQEHLLARAKSLGHADASPPHIDYVSSNGDLQIIDESFDFVVSSYCLEHQPDLIKHLRDVESILKPGGCYLGLVPDKRYCHDHFMSESTIAGILDAHHTHRTTHALRSVIEHVALSAHNDHFRHWDGDHGEQFEDLDARIRTSIQAFERAKGEYVDVHSWYFTPASTVQILETLRRMNYICLQCIRCYETRKYQNDFWLILQKPPNESAEQKYEPAE
jgi:SAM-dependent methyltransferase